MMQKPIFNFEHTYAELPEIFFSKVNPTYVNNPNLLILNEGLMAELGVSKELNVLNLTTVLTGNQIDSNSKPIAQAYAGHQFGNFTMLGDGRAILLGEHLTESGKRFDIQLKGSGRTPYARGGDGRATVKAMLREFLMSEAMHYLGIPSSRSLAVVATGEQIYRNPPQPGAVLTRVMKSHLRVGTFEFASYYGKKDNLQILTDYTISRLFPELKNTENSALALLENVMQLQIDLVAEWMRVGFIHGVMNTDNTSISGETFDYGPCAFMNAYNLKTVFSSIDTQARYAFGNQPNIIKWNLVCLAEALLPIIHNEEQEAISLAQDVINAFEAKWQEKYLATMLKKIGIEDVNPADQHLVTDLLDWMQLNKADFTNTFTDLRSILEGKPQKSQYTDLSNWVMNWKNRVSETEGGLEKALELMKQNNPIYIPRNNLVEAALEKAESNDFSDFDNLLEVVRSPYDFNERYSDFIIPPAMEFEVDYKTFCGT